METHDNLLEGLKSLQPCSDKDNQDTMAQGMMDAYLEKNPDAERYRQEFYHIYRVTDAVTEYLISRESRSRMGDDKFSIVDVRLEPMDMWVMVNYTIIQCGRSYREQFPMLWSTFYDLIKQIDTSKSKNPWTMDTTIFRKGFDYTRPPTYKIRPMCRMVTPEEAYEILQEQVKASSNE